MMSCVCWFSLDATMHGKQTLNGAEQGNGRLHSEDRPSGGQVMSRGTNAC